MNFRKFSRTFLWLKLELIYEFPDSVGVIFVFTKYRRKTANKKGHVTLPVVSGRQSMISEKLSCVLSNLFGLFKLRKVREGQARFRKEIWENTLYHVTQNYTLFFLPNIVLKNISKKIPRKLINPWAANGIHLDANLDVFYLWLINYEHLKTS